VSKNLSILPLKLRHKIALWSCWLFPQILLVALCNSRAMWEADDNSDIDLFIITQQWRLWIGRFLVTLISSLLGVRRQNTHGLIKWSAEYIKKTKEKFCLSFFITEDAMNFNTIRIENDIYLDIWVQTLVPLINKNNTLERFWAANGWEKSSIIYSSLFPFEGLRLKDIRHSIIEKVIKKIWLPHTLKTYEKLWKPWWVIISDTMLKFHDNDQRKIYRDSHTKE